MLSPSFSPYYATPAAQQLRQPRAIVLINGINVLWTDIEITTTTFYTADSYRIVLPLSVQPSNFNMSFLSSVFPMSVKIYIGFPINPDAYTPDDQDLLIVGDVDKLEIDPLSKVVTFTGRDLTSRFIDKKTYKKYPDQSASAIITELAKENGLTPVVTQTSAKSGIFYSQENTLLTRETTEWDLMCFLAQQEDFVLYVEKNNLIFKPRPSSSNDAYLLSYQASNTENASPVFNGMDLKISRSLTLAPGVIVKIRVPYSPQTGKAFTVPVSSPHTRPQSPSTQVYSYTFPGLSKEQALVRGQQILRDITIHELKLEATVPGENTLKKDSMIKLTGTGTSLDQLYFTDQVVRKISYSQGYHMSISAKNHNVDSQIIL